MATRRPVGLAAAGLTVLIVGTLIFVRLHSSSPPLATAPPLPATLQITPISDVVIPHADLERAQLSGSGALVTPMNLAATSGDRTVTLIGAYADSSRIVLFLRSMPTGFLAHATIYDDTGFLNAGGTGGIGIIGDSYIILNTGPHAGSDGMANLKVVVDTLQPVTPSESWTFTFPIRVVPSFHLSLGPPLTNVGSWNFTIGAFEVTSTEVHFQAVIEGAAVDDIKRDTFSLVDLNEKPLQQVAMEAGTILPKDQIGTVPPRSTRVNLAWLRPATGGSYMLRIAGGGAHYVGGVNIPDPVTGKPVTKGAPLAPTDYPSATEAITFEGAFSATVSSANPSSCGVGTGPSGTMFGLAMNFQLNQAWYSIDLSTREGQYSGPGAYNVRAQIWPDRGSAIFDGLVRLTVQSDHYPGPYTGTVRGTLAWTGVDTQPHTVDITGNWTCTPGGQLGPG